MIRLYRTESGRRKLKSSAINDFFKSKDKWCRKFSKYILSCGLGSCRFHRTCPGLIS